MDTARDQRGLGAGEGKARSTSEPPGPTNFIGLDELLSEEERDARNDVRNDVRAFVEEEISPNIKDWYEKAHCPREIVPAMEEKGLLGMHLKGYGCAGKNAVEYGLACKELEAGDTSLRTFVSVQGSLAMSAIHKFGSFGKAVSSFQRPKRSSLT